MLKREINVWVGVQIDLDPGNLNHLSQGQKRMRLKGSMGYEAVICNSHKHSRQCGEVSLSFAKNHVAAAGDRVRPIDKDEEQPYVKAKVSVFGDGL